MDTSLNQPPPYPECGAQAPRRLALVYGELLQKQSGQQAGAGPVYGESAGFHYTFGVFLPWCMAFRVIV
jgi:hypothetical protein